MNTYRIRLRSLGSWCTPWHADSLFGALAWQVRQLAGDEGLEKFLNESHSATPPFILSDASPEGWLPCPLSAELLDGLRDSNLQTKLPAWIPEGQFQSLVREPKPIPPLKEWPEPMVARRNLHASIHRTLGTTTGEGSNLFETREWYFKEVDGKRPEGLVVYVRTDAWLDRVVSLFESLSSVGFGKKRSSGRGAFEVDGQPEVCEWMDQQDGSNAFVALSHFVPAATDPREGRWSVVTKYPKFSPGAPSGAIFKGRLVMLRPGSAFRLSAPIRQFYGQMLKDPSGSVQYARAFAVPMRWPE